MESELEVVEAEVACACDTYSVLISDASLGNLGTDNAFGLTSCEMLRICQTA